jgi:1,2-phenylacetyl-CoA epoxidase catalytic subunit
MTHLFREEDFHVDQQLQMVSRLRDGTERRRQNVKVIRVWRTKKGQLNVGVAYKLADFGGTYTLTVLPSEDGYRTTLEV